jgi:hypothetical protein
VVDVIVAPVKREVIVVAEQGRRIGFCVACRTRAEKGDGDIVSLTEGVADGSLLSDIEFKRSKDESHLHWKARYPNAEIVYLECPVGLKPEVFAKYQAERRVSI